MGNSDQFQSPPVRTPVFAFSGRGIPVWFQNLQWLFSWPWMKWFQQVSVQLSQPVSGEVPATSSAPGEFGQIATDGTYLYVATGTNTWKRASLTGF